MDTAKNYMEQPVVVNDPEPEVAQEVVAEEE